MKYPSWAYFPRQTAAPDWVSGFLAVVAERQSAIDSHEHKTMESDKVVAELRPALLLQGWDVEAGKQHAQRIHRPVLFGDNGQIRVKQEIDGWHAEQKIILEVESGRGIQGNALYRDLVRASLVADARYLVLGLRQRYVYGQRNTVQNDFESARDTLDSIYASGRLLLPFEGVLLFGW